MEDRREQILKQYTIRMDERDICYEKSEVKDAMDENGKQMCLELLEYIAKNKIALDIVNGEVECYLKNGEGITKEQLFENFL